MSFQFKIQEPPKCEEMVKYLITTEGYHKMSRGEMYQDFMLKIVASACNISIDSVVDLTEKLVRDRKLK